MEEDRRAPQATQAGPPRVPAPYGLAFPLEALTEIRHWCEQRHMAMRVQLDRVIDGAEFEELVVVTTQDGRRRLLMLWQTQHEVVAQLVGRMPRPFAADVVTALDTMLTPPARRPWLFPGR